MLEFGRAAKLDISMHYVVGQCGDPCLHCPEDIANHLDHLTHPVPYFGLLPSPLLQLDYGAVQ